ncbi:hypothetical protein KL864_33195 [Mycolicibacterium goodii]|uniref:hypothetical protein n=1 Tax=Mycolicibacterium goodii TaxID=134601 RepID=UPI001BDD8E80|nr:hypothetical protein [Mycolicibacterium goodii]MBU8820727.1 hypothetical protein [Mycolicibacterium goodii]
MSTAVPFADYLGTLGRLSAHIDPLAPTAEAEAIRAATLSLAAVPSINRASLAQWVAEHPHDVPVLGLIVGLGQEKLKNALKHEFDTSGWVLLARNHAAELIEWLDNVYGLVSQANAQLHQTYGVADVLVARAGTRAAATAAGQQGRKVEDEIEGVAMSLGLPYETRTRFVGRNARSAPCDLVIPNGAGAQIVVAAKGFDSTGSKLTDAVREIEEMAEVRTPRQFVLAVIDGIGWKNRIADLRKIHRLWVNQQIDGMYTLATLHQFREDVQEAARLRRLL